MSATPVALFSRAGSRDRSGAITPTKAGAVWDTTLDGAPAWRVLEGTTNLITNPLLTTNANGWDVPSASSVISRDGSFGHDYGTSLKAVCDGSNAAQGVFSANGQIPITVGETITYSVWVYASTPVTLFVAVQERSSSATLGTYNTGSQAIPANKWTQLIITRTMSDATVTQVRVGVWTATAQAATFWTTEHQVEKKAYATPFTPAKDGVGVILPGQQWNGTPDASTSTRTGGAVIIPNANALGMIDFESGSFYMRASDPAMPVSGVRRPFRWGNAISGDGLMTQVAAGQSFSLQSWADASNVNAYAGASVPTGLYTAYGEWLGNAAKSAVNGSVGTTATRLPRIGTKPTSDFIIGAGVASGNQAYNGEIAILLFFDRPLTTEERVRLDATPTAQLGWNSLDDKPVKITPAGIIKPSGSIGPDGLPITPTKVGAVWDVTAPGGKPAWRIVEPTVNYDINPYAANIAHGVNAYTHVSASRITGAGLTLPTGQTIDTATRVAVTSSPGSANLIGFNGGAPVAQGTTVTTSAWIRCSPSLIGKTFYVREQTTGGTGNDTAQNAVVLTGTWQQVEVSCAVTTADRTAMFFYVNPPLASTIAIGDYIDFTVVQSEVKVTRSEFSPAKTVAGSLLPGQAWGGAADASTLTRNGGKITTPRGSMVWGDEGEILLCLHTPRSGWIPGTGRYNSFLAAQTVGNEFVMFVSQTNRAFAYAGNGAGGMSITLPDTNASMYRVSLSWKGGTKSRFQIESQIVESANVLSTAVQLASTLSIGDGGDSEDSVISSVALYNRRLTDAERAKVFAAMADGSIGWQTLFDIPGGIIRSSSPLPLSTMRTKTKGF